MHILGKRGQIAEHYNSPGCANRSGGPPKPGRRLLNGVRQCPRRSARGPLGPDGVLQGPWGRRGEPRRSVHQLCTDTGQSNLSGLVGSRRTKSVYDGFSSDPCFSAMGPDRARRIARLSHIGARLMYGPPGHATASPRALWGLVGTQWTPSGPPAAPSDPV